MKHIHQVVDGGFAGALRCGGERERVDLAGGSGHAAPAGPGRGEADVARRRGAAEGKGSAGVERRERGGAEQAGLITRPEDEIALDHPRVSERQALLIATIGGEGAQVGAPLFTGHDDHAVVVP
jgi:hypothetical protein